jgi:hypothetical protein
MRRLVNYLGYETGLFTFDRELIRSTSDRVTLQCEGNFARKLEQEISGLIGSIDHADFWPHVAPDARLLYLCEEMYFGSTDDLYRQIEETIERIRCVADLYYPGQIYGIETGTDLSSEILQEIVNRLVDGLIPDTCPEESFAYPAFNQNAEHNRSESSGKYTVILQILMADRIILPPLKPSTTNTPVCTEDKERILSLDEMLTLTQKENTHD